MEPNAPGTIPIPITRRSSHAWYWVPAAQHDDCCCCCCWCAPLPVTPAGRTLREQPPPHITHVAVAPAMLGTGCPSHSMTTAAAAAAAAVLPCWAAVAEATPLRAGSQVCRCEHASQDLPITTKHIRRQGQAYKDSSAAQHQAATPGSKQQGREV